jgi:hypothetical protein
MKTQESVQSIINELPEYNFSNAQLYREGLILNGVLKEFWGTHLELDSHVSVDDLRRIYDSAHRHNATAKLNLLHKEDGSKALILDIQ